MQQSQQYQTIDKKYLIKQNRRLRMQLKQCKDLTKMHKQAVIVLSNPHINSSNILKTLINIIKSNTDTKIVQNLRKQIGQLQSKIMVFEKIVEQAINSQKQTYNLLVNKFQQLKQDNMKKDDQLNKFYQKIGQVDYLSGLVTKYIQVLVPSQQTMAFQKQQSQLLDMLNLQKDAIKKLSYQKQQLIKINLHFKQQLDRKKQDIRNITLLIDQNNQNHSGNVTNMILGDLDQDKSISNGGNYSFNYNNLSHSLNVTNNYQNYSNVTALQFIKLQNQLIKEENSGDSDNDGADCPELSILFPDKVRQIKTTRQKKKVPYLNMLKVRQLMTKRQKKLNKQQQANGNINPTTKIIKLQGQLEITRKQLSNYMLKFRVFEQQNKTMKEHIQQIQSRNALLLQSNGRLTQIYKQLFQQYQFCRAVTVHLESLTGQKLRGQSFKTIIDKIDKMIKPLIKKNRQNNQFNLNLTNILLNLSQNNRKKSSSF